MRNGSSNRSLGEGEADLGYWDRARNSDHRDPIPGSYKIERVGPALLEATWRNQGSVDVGSSPTVSLWDHYLTLCTSVPSSVCGNNQVCSVHLQSLLVTPFSSTYCTVPGIGLWRWTRCIFALTEPTEHRKRLTYSQLCYNDKGRGRDDTAVQRRAAYVGQSFLEALE